MKKKALVLAICMAVSTPAMSIAQGLPNDIVGLNLGDIQSSSSLGEPFKGMIPILFSSPEKVSQVKVSIAPDHIFQKIGAEKLPFLDDLSFNTGIKNNQPVIFVQSSLPINMPFISLVLEMSSIQGTVYQDYTVLIDPPGYEESKLKASPLSQATTPSIKISKDKDIQYKVTAGDTLSKIAEALKTTQISLKKMIDVIHQVNPTAFVDNDIDKLKSGVYLKVPSVTKVKNFEFKSVSNSSTETNNADKNTPAKTYTVIKGDTLSVITEKFKHQNISFTKRMHAIYNANPHAFSKNKINVLKVGSVLSIPYSIEVTEAETAEEKHQTTQEAEVNQLDSEEVIVMEFDDSEVETSALAKESSSDKAESTIKESTDNKVEAAIEESTSIELEATAKTPSDNDLRSVVKTFENNEEEAFIKEANEPSLTEDTTVNETQVSKTQSVEAQSKAESINIISNLEKRLRELRTNLSESKSKLSYLEDILVTRNIEIKKKNREIRSLKEYVAEEFGAEELNELDEQLPIESTTKDTSSQGSEEQNVNTIPLPSSSLRDEHLSLATILSGYKFKSSSDLMVSLKSLTFSDITYGFIALLLALGLITYRKELHSYVLASDDYPKFYPPEEGQEALTIKESIDLNISTPETQTVSVKTGVSDSILAECEKLVDDLYEELHNDPADKLESSDKEWKTLEQICENYIEEHSDDDSQYDISISTKIDNDHLESDKIETSFEDMVSNLIDTDNALFDNSNPLDDIHTRPKQQPKKDRLKKRSTHIEGNYY